MADDSYTLKELVQELRLETSNQSRVLTTMTSTLQGIETHLAQLNIKVASHEKKLYDYDMLKSKGMMIWALAVFGITTFINKMF